MSHSLLQVFAGQKKSAHAYEWLSQLHAGLVQAASGWLSWIEICPSLIN
jgi:hypothetical protein